MQGARCPSGRCSRCGDGQGSGVTAVLTGGPAWTSSVRGSLREVRVERIHLVVLEYVEKMVDVRDCSVRAFWK